MLKGSRKYWFIALVFGLITAILSYRYMQDLKESYSPADQVKVVKAREEIARDTVIKKEQIETVSLPGRYVHPDALKEEDMVIGKISTSEISAGEEILKEKLLSAEDREQRLAYKVPVSKRAVSIPVNSVSGVSGFIEAGDRVDIIATVDISQPASGGNEEKRSYSILTLQDIEVLAVGENLNGTEKKESVEGQTLTLAVSLQEAQPLVLASERGNLRLLLRHPVDKNKADLAPYQLRNFLGQ